MKQIIKINFTLFNNINFSARSLGRQALEHPEGKADVIGSGSCPMTVFGIRVIHFAVRRPMLSSAFHFSAALEGFSTILSLEHKAFSI
jgi:hypothetical protein